MADGAGKQRRLERWALQSAARDLMERERVSWCFRRPGFDWLELRPFRDVRLMFSQAVHRAHYKNLMVCGSVWMCPICAAKITERRRVELSSAIKRTALRPVLVTFTLSHNRGDRLRDVLGVLLKSYERMKQGKRYHSFKHQTNLVGSVRALEVTHGANGWHPHLHVLFFIRGKFDADVLKEFFFDRWAHQLKRNHASALFDYGVDVRTGDKDVAEYVAKFGHEPLKDAGRWGLEHELTKSPAKRSKGDAGRSPLQLLADYAGGDKQAGAIWKEYAVTFKGKRQLVWSKGLRAILGLGQEKTDEEIAKEEREDAILLAALPLKVWRVVLANDARGELLEIAHDGDADKVWNFLDELGALRDFDKASLARMSQRLNAVALPGAVFVT